jgi:hypothetical protein
MGGFLILTNNACNFSGAVPELRAAASVQFEFKGTPSPTAACGPPKFNVAKWTACGRNNVSQTVNVLDWIDQGAVSPSEWRKVGRSQWMEGDANLESIRGRAQPILQHSHLRMSRTPHHPPGQRAHGQAAGQCWTAALRRRRLEP